MAGEVKLEILFGRSVYVLRSPECERLLAGLDAVPEIGTVTGTLREDLRKALSGVESAVTAPNPFDEDTEDEIAAKRDAAEILKNIATLKNVAKENAEACGDCRKPRCRFCDQPGRRVAGIKDTGGTVTDWYYLCETEGCIAAKMRTPQPLRQFTGGAE